MMIMMIIIFFIQDKIKSTYVTSLPMVANMMNMMIVTIMMIIIFHIQDKIKSTYVTSLPVIASASTLAMISSII